MQLEKQAAYKQKEIREIGAYLKFETDSMVTLTEIDKDTQKYHRCVKALNEKNQQRPDGEEKLILLSAFKVDNKILLNHFEREREEVQEGYDNKQVLLKGLFV